MRDLVIDNPAGRVYNQGAKTTSGNDSHQYLWFCYATLQPHIFDTERSRGVLTGGLPQVVQTLPDGSSTAFCVFYNRRASMSGNTESTTSSTPVVPTLHYWQLFATDGPADLYRGFAIDAVDEYLRTQGTITDEQMSIITECVNIAATVALRAAGVTDSWLPMYQAARGAE